MLCYDYIINKLEIGIYVYFHCTKYRLCCHMIVHFASKGSNLYKNLLYWFYILIIIRYFENNI